MLQKSCHRLGFLEVQVDTAMETGTNIFLLGMDRKQAWLEEEEELLLESKESSTNLGGSSRVSPGPQSSWCQVENGQPFLLDTVRPRKGVIPNKVALCVEVDPGEADIWDCLLTTLQNCAVSPFLKGNPGSIFLHLSQNATQTGLNNKGMS